MRYFLLVFLAFFAANITAWSQVTVTTLAGNGSSGSTDGSGSSVSFKNPYGVAVDGSGNVYVADYGNHKIRKITPAGVITTLAGSGSIGSADGSGSSASFNYPSGVAVDGNGNIYVTEYKNNKIRKITPAGVVSTLAGNGSFGSADGNGVTASFSFPFGIAVDGSGNVYVTDNGNHKIRKITPAGVVSTLAGSGSASSTDGTGVSASFNAPSGISVDGNGNLYVTDFSTNKIRKVTPAGVVSTLAGSGSVGSVDGTGVSASFNGPESVAVDGSGNIYVADANNNKIRKITPMGEVSTLAGNGSVGSADGMGPSASFSYPGGIAVDGSGTIFVADYGNNKIRKITAGTLPVNLISFTAAKQGSTIALAWQTASEKNNTQFILSRSADGKNFTELTRIAGAGNSSTPKNYVYTDRNPLKAANYYKLEQVDGDGKINEVGMQVVNFELSASVLSVYPNPTAGEINLTLAASFGTSVVVSITNTSGKTVYLEKIQLIQGQRSYKLRNKQLAKGQYVVRVVGEKHTEALKILLR